MLIDILGKSLRDLLHSRPKQALLLVEGWRNISQSYAMVNQYQLLELARRPEFRLHHRDMPFLTDAWTADRAGAGFDAHQAAILDSLCDLPDGMADITYRIDVPFRLDAASRGRTFVQGTSEFRSLLDGNFRGGAAAMQAQRARPVTIVTPSRWSREGFLSYGFEERQVRVVPHGVDFKLYRPLDGEARPHARRQFGFGAQSFVFLSVGAMTWNKGIDLLLRAFARVSKKHPHARLVLKDASKLYNVSAADLVGGMRHDFPAEFDEGVLNAITLSTENFTRAQLAQLYGACDAYVSPYRAEGFGLTPLEAAACGVPVIVTAGGSTDDYAHPSFTLKVPAQPMQNEGKHYLEADLDELTAAMMRLIEGDASAIERGAALDYLHRQFSWKSVAERLTGIFMEASQ